MLSYMMSTFSNITSLMEHNTQEHLVDMLEALAEVKLEVIDAQITYSSWSSCSAYEKRRLTNAFIYIVCYVYQNTFDGLVDMDDDMLEYINNYMEDDAHFPHAVEKTSTLGKFSEEQLNVFHEFYIHVFSVLEMCQSLNIFIISSKHINQLAMFEQYDLFYAWHTSTPQQIRHMVYEMNMKPWLNPNHGIPEECELNL